MLARKKYLYEVGLTRLTLNHFFPQTNNEAKATLDSGLTAEKKKDIFYYFLSPEFETAVTSSYIVVTQSNR